ncbi:hypothetical protein COV12_02520 [Candidatus Woesearchaeota archaeon CG10_big_fil_rev_8_21_14_0_10_32_24]|nr:MAG: hypothetical protein COV12_02520 [Candidatus Woesearchaeota archaeon CG10_big_fil_rev_8_21_14_0_10_32_24]
MKVASGSGSVTSVSGDAWMVGTSAKKFEMGNMSARGEQIYDIETFISKDELGALADGSYSTSGSSSAYQQYLYFDTRNVDTNEIVTFVENDNDVTADFFFVDSGANIGEYVLEFSSAPESTIQNVAGSASTTGTILDDFENTKLSMLGMEYDVVLARRTASPAEDSIKLTLMGGATRGSLLEGDSTSLSLDGKTYDVTLSYVDSTYVKFVVNGEQSDKLQVGDTFKLADGNEIGVSESLYQSYAGGVHSADFFLGASKIELADTDITDTDSSTALKVGTETISGADVIIEGTDNNVTFTLSKIHVNMTAQDDYYVAVGKKLSDAVVEQGDDKELVFSNNWDIEYKGLTEEATHEIKLKSSTDSKYSLVWYDGNGDMVDMPFVYANSTTDVQLSEGASDKEVILNEGLNISKDDYFVVTANGDAADGTGKSFALQYKGSDKSTATSPKIKFKNLGNGETLEYALDTGTDNTVATLKLGGYSFVVQNMSSKETADFTIAADLDGDGTAGEADSEIDIVDNYGIDINFGGTLYANGTGGNTIGDGWVQPVATGGATAAVTLTLTSPDGNDYDNQQPATMILTVDGTTGTEVTVSSFTINGVTQNLLTPEGEENIAYGYNELGAKMTYTTPSSSPQAFTYEVPENQRIPQVYVTSGATTSAKTGGNLVAVTIVDATKLDSEVSTVDAQNVIAVGGPCANSVAASLLGNPADCTEGFSAGKARIKLFEHANGKVAMLVAGFSGADTRLAGKVIAHRASELSGMEVEVEGTTYTDATIGAPKAVVAAPVVETTE